MGAEINSTLQDANPLEIWLNSDLDDRYLSQYKKKAEDIVEEAKLTDQEMIVYLTLIKDPYCAISHTNILGNVLGSTTTSNLTAERLKNWVNNIRRKIEPKKNKEPYIIDIENRGYAYVGPHILTGETDFELNLDTLDADLSFKSTTLENLNNRLQSGR